MKKILVFISVVFFLGCGQANVLGSRSSISTPPNHVSKKVPILMYHYIRDVDRSSDLIGWNLSVTPDLFDRHMKYLADNGYVTLHLSDLLEGIVPEKSVILTFDDGTEDFYLNAFPILKKYGFTGSSGVVSGFVGTDGYMSAKEISEVVKGGIEVLSHSADHRNMVSLSKNDLKWEVDYSKDALKNGFGIAVDGFVYPSGYYNNRVVGAVKNAGYSIAVTTDFGVADLGVDDLLKLPRVRIDNRDSFERFVEKVSGI